MTIGTPAFRGSRVLCASWAAAEPHALLERIDAECAGWRVCRGEGWLLATEQGDCAFDDAGVALGTTVTQVFDRAHGAMRGPAALAALVSSDPCGVDGLGAPYRLIWADRADGSLHAACDQSGLGHLFIAQEGGVALCASSATLLGTLIAAPPDRLSLAAFAQLGTFPFAATPYGGVTKLLAGDRATLAGGRLSIEASPAAADGGTLDDAFRDAVAAMLSAAPDAALELSGGLDSRLILAALPHSARPDRLAITLDASGGTGPEYRVASHVARLANLDHHRAILSLGNDVDNDALGALIDTVVDGYDTMANPIDKLPLVLAGEDDRAAARFGGQNGEIIRGFYYPMQPLSAVTDRNLVEKLVDWRLIANDRAAPRLFSSHGREALATARADLVERLVEYVGPWGETLDRIYLHYRMQGWAGNAVSNRFAGRAIFWPFFDQRFLHAALALPAAAKHNSRAGYVLLKRLDPALAAIPLDNGLVPAQLASGAVRARVAQGRAVIAKGMRKLIQRARPAAGAVLGADDLIDRWHRAALYRRLDLNRLAALDLFDTSALDEIGRGAWKPDRPTLGFLLLCNRLVTR